MEVLFATLSAGAVLFALHTRSRAVGAAAATEDDGSARWAVSRVRALQLKHSLGLACRHHFYIDFVAAVHLNHGSYGAAPRPVVRAATAAMEAIEAWPDRFMRRTALDQVSAAADAAGAYYFRAPAGTCAFVENATAGVNAILRSAGLPKDSAILIFNHTYNACKNAALDTAAHMGLDVVTAQIPLPLERASGQSHSDALVSLLDAALAAQGGRVSLVLLDHITSPTAILMPVARLAATARAHGAKVLIDGAHAPAQVRDLDVPSMGGDWYVGNLHKWAFTLKGVALLWAGEAVRASTQGVVISHFWTRPFQDRFFMQGTLDYSRYLSAAAGIAFVDTHLGGGDAMRTHNAALAEAGARVLEEAWRGVAGPSPIRMLEPGAERVPFLAVVRTPLDWRAWVRTSGGGDARGLPRDEALASLDADGGLPERLANAVLAACGVQSVFYAWPWGGEPCIWNRVSAQVYNVVADYEALARGVLAVKGAE